MPAKNYVPPRINRYEREMLKTYLKLPGWQFDMIKERCLEADSHYVDWDSETQAIVYAHVYILPAIKAGTKLRCVANYFVRYQNRVYQSESLHDVVTLLDLLLKERIYNDYIDRKENINRKVKQ